MPSAKVYVPDGVNIGDLADERIPGQLRLAVVGGGMIAENFYGPIIEELRALHNLTLIALVDPYSGEESADTHRCALYRDLDWMLDDMKPNGTIICTPTALHGEMAAAALRKDRVC